MSQTLSLKVITARANPAVSLSDAKAYLRVDGSAEDTLISGLVSAATDMVEKMTRRSLVNQTFRWSFDEFPAGPVELPRSPVSSISIGGAYAYAMPRVRYYDQDGIQQTAVVDEDYFLDLDNNPPSLQLYPFTIWPLTELDRAKAVEVDFVAGYGATSASVPELLRQAVLMLVAHWFENRMAVGQVGTELPLAVDSILRIYSDGAY